MHAFEQIALALIYVYDVLCFIEWMMMMKISSRRNYTKGIRGAVEHLNASNKIYAHSNRRCGINSGNDHNSFL